MFDVDPLPYEERRIATGLRGPDGRPGAVHALHIDAESALLEYLSMYYKLGRAGRALDRFGVIDFATTIAPGRPRRAAHRQGLRGRAAQQPQQGRHASTTPWCSTPRRPAGSPSSSTSTTSSPGWPRSARSSSQADTVMTLFRSPRTAVHLVTVLEEMPVQETADGIAELREARAARSAASWSTWCGPATSTPTTCAAARDGQARPARRSRPTSTAAGVDVDARRWSTGCSPRPATTPSAGRSRTRSASSIAELGRADLRAAPAAPAASTSAASTSWPPTSSEQGMA